MICKSKRCKLYNSHPMRCLCILLHRKEQLTVAKSNAKPFKPSGTHFVFHSYSKSIVLPLVTPHIVFGKSSSNERSVSLVSSLHGAQRSAPPEICDKRIKSSFEVHSWRTFEKQSVRNGINIEPLISQIVFRKFKHY